jgi:hypothetical protein
MPQENNKLIIKSEDKNVIEVHNPSYEQVFDALMKHPCTIFFIKVTDGKTRKMKCTLQQMYMEGKYKNSRLLGLAMNYWKQNSGTQVTNTYGKRKFKTRVFKYNLLPVWDLEKNNWRSFYTDKITLMIIDTTTDLV